MAVLSPLRDETEKTEDVSDDDDDIEVLRRACELAGINPNEINDNSTATQNNPATAASYADSESESDDDLELARNIEKRFSVPGDVNRPLILKPLCSLPPVASDDDEDDLETLRSLEKRFPKYDAGPLEKNPDSNLNIPQPVGGTEVSQDLETASPLFTEGKAEARHEDLSYSEKACNAGRALDSCNETGFQNQPSNFIGWHESEATGSSAVSAKCSGFLNPEAARVFLDAIKKNRSCQKFIRSKLIQIEARIEENKRLKERVKVLKDFQVACRRRAGRALSQRKDARVQLISVRKSRKSRKMNTKFPAMYFGPIENSHAANYRMVLQRSPISFIRQRWTDADKKNLLEGIKQQFQEKLLQNSVEAYSTNDDSNVLDAMIASISEFEITPSNIRTFLPKVDWERLASTYLTGRSGAECEQRWLNNEDPLINQKPWTKYEDKKLLFTLQQQGIYNWINISMALRTSRTPFQCLARYQRSLNANILKRDWTKDEDDQLRGAVEAYGERNWQQIAFNLDGRTGTQCSNRWYKSLHPTRIRVGRWTVDEDKRLKVALILFGAKTWQKIAQFVPGRTQVQCRERWVNCLDPSLNLEPWTEEEDCKLRAAIAEYGHCWSKVAASVPPRTDSQCRRRWKILLPHEVPVAQAAKNILKVALISNFVDRGAERPALDHLDFLPLPGTKSITGPENGENIEDGKKRRRKAKSRKIKDVSFREAETCDGENLRITNGDENVENCGEDGAVLGKRKRAPYRRLKRKQGADNQNIPVPPEDSTVLMIIGDDDNIEKSVENGTVSRKKKMTPRRCSKKIQSANQAPSDPSCSSNMITDNGDIVENCGGEGIVSKKRKMAAKKSLKRNSCDNSLPGNEVLEESTTVSTSNGDNNIQNGDENVTISQMMKLVPKKRQRRNQYANPGTQDSQLTEDSTNVRVRNGDDTIQNCGEDANILGKRKQTPKKKNQCANPVPGTQDSQLTADSTNFRVTNGDDSNQDFPQDGNVSGKRKHAPRKARKSNQQGNQVQGTQGSPMTKVSTNLTVTSGDDNILNSSEHNNISGKKKLAQRKPQKRRNQDANPVLGAQDTNPVLGAQDTNPVVGAQDTNPVLGAQETNPVLGTQDTNPVLGTQDTNQVLGAQDTNPVLGTQDTNPVPGTQDTNPVLGTQDTLLPENATTSSITNGDNNNQNHGKDGTITERTKRAPQHRCEEADLVLGTQDIPSSENSTDIQNCDKDDIILVNERTAPLKQYQRRKRNTKSTPTDQDAPLSRENQQI